MRAAEFASAALRAWESNDWDGLATLLSDDFVCRDHLPQPVQKAQYLGFVQAIMKAMPDWSFHDHFLRRGPCDVARREGILRHTDYCYTHRRSHSAGSSHYPAHRYKNFVAIQTTGQLCQRGDHQGDHSRFLPQFPGGDTCTDGDGAALR